MNLASRWAASAAFQREQAFRHALTRAHGFVRWEEVVRGRGLFASATVEQRGEILTAAGYPHRVVGTLLALQALVESGREVKSWTLRDRSEFYFSDPEDAVFFSLLAH